MSALPLPSNQPLNQNVLSTDKPSPAPAPPAPKAGRPTTTPPFLSRASKRNRSPRRSLHPRLRSPSDTANCGIRRTGRQQHPARGARRSTTGPTSIAQGDFGSRFPWYVEGINRKMSATWYKGEVDPRTPEGSTRPTRLHDPSRRHGGRNDVTVERSSGSSTLDRSCLRAVQRIDTFGMLPGGYNGSSLHVSYYCEY